MARPMRQDRRVRKRTFVVTGISLLVVLAVSGALALFASAQVKATDVVSFSVHEGEKRTDVLGCGLSLSSAESSNLLRDASFEPIVFRQSLTIFSGDSSTITVSSEAASAGLYGDGFFDGADARIMTTQGSGGSMLKKTAKVSHYGINRVGVFQPVNLPGDLPVKAAIRSFARRGDLSVAVGDKGLILVNVTGQMPEIVESGTTAGLTGVCASNGGFYACGETGEILFSPDGDEWTGVSGHPEAVLNAIAVSEEGLIVAVGNKGAVVTGTPGDIAAVASRHSIYKIESGIKEDLNDIAYGLSTFVAVGDKGAVLLSKTGLIWRKADVAAESSWRSVDFKDGRFVLTGDKSAVASSDDGLTFVLEPMQDGSDLIDIVMLSRQQLIALADDGSFSVSSDGGKTWLHSAIDTGMNSRIIALAGKDKIISADASGKLGLAQLVAEIQLDSSLKEGQYQAGDLIFLEKSVVEIPDSYLVSPGQSIDDADPWDNFGPGSCRRVDEAPSPGGGTGVMLIQADPDKPDQPCILSQAVDHELLADAGPNETFRIDLWMKQSDVASREVQVWLTGAFQPIGTTFTNVGSTWKKYAFSFVLPLWAVSPENRDIRLNIAASGGKVWVDQVSLCRSVDAADLLSRSYRQIIKSISPELIRLDFLKIGSQTVRQNSWSNTLGNETPYLSSLGWHENTAGSLHAALKMVKESTADPWIVLDAHTSETELLNLIEYLAGPISEPYGKLRQDQGDVVPWTSAFNRIFIEATDNASVYGTDRQRADFVDLMIRTIINSPYYREIKGILVFIDGMTYSDGVMLSTADYHASDLGGLIAAARPQAISQIYLSYLDQIPRNPDKPAQTWLELIRSAKLRPNGTNLPNLADLTELLLLDLGDHSLLSNLSLPARDSQEWQACWPAAASIAALAAHGIPLDISDPSDKVFAHGFADDDQITVVLTNLSDQPVTCQLVTDLPLRQAEIFKYDENGALLSKDRLRRTGNKIAVLPGGVVLIRKLLSEE